MKYEDYIRYINTYDDIWRDIARKMRWTKDTDASEHTYIDIEPYPWGFDTIDAVLVFADGTIEFHLANESDAFCWTEWDVEVNNEIIKRIKNKKMKYTWKASSNDGCYEVKANRVFDTKIEAYNDMRDEALEKMKWNTEWSDVEEYDTIGYQVHFSRNKIVHESYSGIYTYEIFGVHDKVKLHDRTWEVMDSFTPKEMYDWLIATFDGVGEMWMNNHDGYIVLIEPSGRILKSDI